MKVCVYDYDCVLLDLTHPGGNGLDIPREIQHRKATTGIIIVSAENSADDKVKSLEIWAHDYLAKSFHSAELNMRVLLPTVFLYISTQNVCHITTRHRRFCDLPSFTR